LIRHFSISDVKAKSDKPVPRHDETNDERSFSRRHLRFHLAQQKPEAIPRSIVDIIECRTPAPNSDEALLLDQKINRLFPPLDRDALTEFFAIEHTMDIEQTILIQQSEREFQRECLSMKRNAEAAQQPKSIPSNRPTFKNGMVQLK